MQNELTGAARQPASAARARELSPTSDERLFYEPPTVDVADLTQAIAGPGGSQQDDNFVGNKPGADPGRRSRRGGPLG